MLVMNRGNSISQHSINLCIRYLKYDFCIEFYIDREDIVYARINSKGCFGSFRQTMLYSSLANQKYKVNCWDLQYKQKLLLL